MTTSDNMNMKQMRETSPVAAMMLDLMKNDLLLVLVNRLGGDIEIPVAEIDNVHGFAMSMKLDQDKRVFRFTTTRADGSPCVVPKSAPTWPPAEGTKSLLGTDTPVGKYDEVLKPFLALMEKELHANAGKGDRPGWLQMTRDESVLEIYYHVAKLQKAVRDAKPEAIREHAADVANMSMMAADSFGNLTKPTK